MVEKDGKETYFDVEGRILGIKDRYDNWIKFYYEDLKYQVNTTGITKRLIKRIVDSVGREFRIDYNEAPDGQSTVTVNLPNGKKLIYKKKPIVTSNGYATRTALFEMIDADGTAKYRLVGSLQNLGFTYTKGTDYSYQNLRYCIEGIEDLRNHKYTSYSYGTYTKNFGIGGSVQYKKVEVEDVYSISAELPDPEPGTLSSLLLLKQKEFSYKYTNEPDGYGTSGYNGSDNNYLDNIYRYYTEVTDNITGSKMKYTYDGENRLITLEDYGKEHKIITTTAYDSNKLSTKKVKEIYNVINNVVSGSPERTVENYSYDDKGNLTKYYNNLANRDGNDNPTDDEHAVSYTYGVFSVLSSKIWKIDNATIAQIQFTIDEKSGNIKQERRVHTGNDIVIDYDYEDVNSKGNMTKKTVHYADNSGNTYVTNYVYGVDFNGTDQKSAYLTGEYGYIDGKITSIDYTYDFNTGNKTAELIPSVKDPLIKEKTDYQYDSLNRVTEIDYPDSTSKKYEYLSTIPDGSSETKFFMIKYTDQDKHKFLYEYDIFGELLTYSKCDGSFKEGSRTGLLTIASYTYDSNGNKTSETDAKGNRTNYNYDSANRLIGKSLVDTNGKTINEKTLSYNAGVSNNDIIYKYNFSQQPNGGTWHGFDIPVEIGKEYKYSFDVYISPDADIPSTGSMFVANGENGFKVDAYYDNTLKGTWYHYEYSSSATNTTARILLYPTRHPSTNPDIEEPPTVSKGFILYKNVQFKKEGSDTNLFPVAINNNQFSIQGYGKFECIDQSNNSYNLYKYDYNQNVDWSWHGFDIPVNTVSKYTFSLDAYISPDAEMASNETTAPLIARGEQGYAEEFRYDFTRKGTWQHFEFSQNATGTNARILLYPSASTIPVTKGFILYKNVQFKQEGTDINLFPAVENNNKFSIQANGRFECINADFKTTIRDKAGDNNYVIKNYYYDKAANLVYEEDASDAKTTKLNEYAYNYAGNKIVTTDGLNNAASKKYDDLGRLIEDWTTVLKDYDESGKLKSDWQAESVVALYEYDAAGNLTKKIVPKVNNTSGSPAAVSYGYDYDVYGRLIRKKEPYTELDENLKVDNNLAVKFAITRLIYDYNGNLIKIITPNNYDASKDVNDDTALGMVGTRYIYDSMNRKTETLVEEIDKFDSNNNRIIDGKPVEYIKYDGNGNVAKKVDGLRFKDNIDASKGTTYSYDEFNRVTDVTNPLGNNVHTVYDEVGNVKAVSRNHIEYDTTGNVKAVTDLKQTTSYEYNPDHTLRVITLPDKYSSTINYDYNMLGQKVSETNPNGNITNYEYDKITGKVKKIIDPKPRDNKGVVQTNAPDVYVEYTYAINGNMISSKDKNGNVANFVYDANGRLILKTVPIEKNDTNTYYYVERYSYDLRGNLIKKEQTGTKDPNTGRATTYVYGENGKVLSQTDYTGAEHYYTYDQDNNVTKSVSYIGIDTPVITKYEYDNKDRLIKSINLVKETDIYNSNSLSNIANLRDKNYSGYIQLITGYEYDILGNKTKETAPAAYGYLDGDTVNRDKYSTSYEYDELGRLIKKKWLFNGSQVTSSTVYDDVNNKKTETNERGYSTVYAYDSMNRLISIQDPLGNILSYEYDKAGNKTKEVNSKPLVVEDTSELGTKYQTIFYDYDELNRLVTTRDTHNVVIDHKVYDRNGNVVKEIDAIGYASGSDDNSRYGTTYEYNLANLQVKVVDPRVAKIGANAFTSRYEYNQFEQKIKDIDGLNHITTYNYDNRGLLTSVVDGENVTTTYVLDDAGDKLSMTDGRLKRTKYSYNALGKLLSETDAENNTASYTYDLNMNLVNLVDKNKNQTLYGYDNRNLLTSKSVTNLVTQVKDKIQFSYDAVGNRISMIDSTGTYQYDYNENNWLNSIGIVITNPTIDPGTGPTYVSGGSSTTGPTIGTGGGQVPTVTVIPLISYTYDILGNVLSITDKKGFTTNYTYDDTNRLNTVTFAGKTTKYTYYANGNRRSIDYPNGITEEYSYFEDNKVKTVANGKIVPEANPPQYSYYYDMDETPGSTTGYVYDPIFSRYSYEYYENGLQKAKTDYYGNKTTYTYDEDNKIKKIETKGKTSDFIYDGSGNRKYLIESHTSDQPSDYTDDGSTSQVMYRTKATDYVYSDANRLAASIETMKDSNGTEILRRTTSYSYDYNGNELSEKTSYERSNGPLVSGGLAANTFDAEDTSAVNNKINMTINQYDGFNRLKTVQSLKGGKKSITEYVYNGDDQRVQKTVRNIDNKFVPEVTKYQYDGKYIILETDGSDNVKNRYIKGINYIARIDASNKICYMMYNAHGDMVQTIDEGGNIENEYEYDIFGNVTPLQEKYSFAIKYSGEYYDNETGLYYLRARYYNPYIGRFISEDTFTGSDDDPLSLNLYTYCSNDPINYIDPTGHYEISTDGGTYYDGSGNVYDPAGNLIGNTSGSVLSVDASKYSDDVVRLQKLLVSYGYQITVDGYFGNNTLATVRLFQERNGLTVDGIVGQRTWEALYKILPTEHNSVHYDMTTVSEVSDENEKLIKLIMQKYPLKTMEEANQYIYEEVWYGLDKKKYKKDDTKYLPEYIVVPTDDKSNPYLYFVLSETQYPMGILPEDVQAMGDIVGRNYRTYEYYPQNDSDFLQTWAELTNGAYCSRALTEGGGVSNFLKVVNAEDLSIIELNAAKIVTRKGMKYLIDSNGETPIGSAYSETINEEVNVKTPNLKTGQGYDAGDTPVRIEGEWSINDMKQALLGHPPKGLGSPDLHHGGQMPGAAKHEIISDLHRNNSALHPNKYNQGVTPEMRVSDKNLHWWYRAREQGADQLLPDWIYDK